MKKVSIKPIDGASNFNRSHARVVSQTVYAVSRDRMLQVREMNSYLMRAPGLYLNVEQSEFIKTASRAPSRKRRATASRFCNAHFDAMSRMAAYRKIDCALLILHSAIDQRNITLLYSSCCELIGESLMSNLIFSRYKQP